MPVFIALLRGINVTGNNKLLMKDLCVLCEEGGFRNVRTYIQSGNVIFQSTLRETSVRDRLGNVLAKKMGKKVDVMVRTAAELRAVLEANPFPYAPPERVGVAFLGAAPPHTLLQEIAGQTNEEVHAGTREVYIYFPDGMGKSRLKLPSSAGPATIRNINTVAKLVEMAA